MGLPTLPVVSDPKLRAVPLGDGKTRYVFGMRLACSVREYARQNGGCGVSVDVCYMPKKLELVAQLFKSGHNAQNPSSQGQRSVNGDISSATINTNKPFSGASENWQAAQHLPTDTKRQRQNTRFNVPCVMLDGTHLGVEICV